MPGKASPHEAPHVEAVVINDELDAPQADDGVLVIDEGTEKELPDGATLLADGRVRLALKHPVTLTYRTARDKAERTETFAELVMRPLVGADFIAADSAGNRATVMLVARSAGLSPQKGSAVFDKMRMSDISAATQVLSFFG